MKIGPATKSFGRQRFLLSFLYSNMIFLAIAANLAAQTTSVVEGRVTDQQGLAIEGVVVRARNLAAAIDRGTVTDASGEYRVVGLAAGVYAITASKVGFAPETGAALEITMNRAVALNLTLRLVAQIQELEI